MFGIWENVLPSDLPLSSCTYDGQGQHFYHLSAFLSRKKVQSGFFPLMSHSTSDGENVDLGLDAPKLIQQNYKRLRWWKEILAVIVTKLSERECVWVCVKREREWVWMCVKERERECVCECVWKRVCVCVCVCAWEPLRNCESNCAWDCLLEQL